MPAISFQTTQRTLIPTYAGLVGVEDREFQDVCSSV
jgi:hypothetical protein